MIFQYIESINIKCRRCETTIDIKMYPKDESLRDNINRLRCPVCGEILSDLASSAYHLAFEYNKACQCAEKKQSEECCFRDQSRR